MPLFETHQEGSIYLSMHDGAESLSRIAEISFNLDGKEWPSVEHYYQAMKFQNDNERETILALELPADASKYANSWRRKLKIRKDWKKIKTTAMTRAIYTLCRTHQGIAQRLLDTADKQLVENSQFDYFWGCGRDKRGKNNYGKVLMNVRNKLREELSQSEHT